MGTCNCVVFKKLTNAYLHQLREKSCNFFLKIYMKRASQIVKTDEVLTARAICILRSCYNFALELNEKCNQFQPIRSA